MNAREIPMAATIRARMINFINAGRFFTLLGPKSLRLFIRV